MDRVVLKVSQRSERGKGEVKQLRQKGLTPAVVYGELGNEVISVDTIDFENILKNHRTLGSIVFNIEFDASGKNRATVVREIQRHPLNGQILNIDFKEVSMKEKIVSQVPLVTKGDSVGIQAGGVLEQHMWEIHVRCLPTQIPDEYKVDISHLNIGDFLHVSDLPQDGDIEVSEAPKELILAIGTPRKATEFDTEEGEEAPSEPEVTGQKNAAEDESAE